MIGWRERRADTEAVQPRSPLMRGLSALPDAVSAGFFLLVWVAPMALGAGSVKTAMLIMMVEFIMVHSAGFLGTTAYAENISRANKVKALIGFTLFYLVFILSFSLIFAEWWPIIAFGWLLLAKFGIALDRRAPASDQRTRAQSGWGLSVIAYLGGVFSTLILPIPRLGISKELQPLFDIPGSGEWVDNPHTVVAFGALYFGFLAWVKWKDWLLPANELAKRT
jgi:hypothetical protein